MPKFSRRKFLRGTSEVSAMLLFFGGCSNSKSDTTNPKTPKSETINLTFSDNDEFYEKLQAALDKNQKVEVRFDGKEKVNEHSRLVSEFLGKAENQKELVKQLADLDTKDGRKKLSHGLDASLLGPKKSKKAIKKSNGEVIEPGMVIIAIAVLITTAYAIHEGYIVRINGNEDGISLTFEPVA